MILDVSLATGSDVRALYSILQDTATWLKQKGIEQWTNLKSESDFSDDVARGLVFKIKADGVLVGTVTLTPRRDPYWLDDGVSALYLHKIAIQREFKGRHLGGAVLNWAEQETRRQGYDSLRLDCINHNPILIAYYTAQGFEDKGVGSIGEKRWRLFEKAVDGRTSY